MSKANERIVIDGKQYDITVENGYYAECKNIQGCYSQGETVEEAKSNIEDAIKLHLEESNSIFLHETSFDYAKDADVSSFWYPGCPINVNEKKIVSSFVLSDAVKEICVDDFKVRDGKKYIMVGWGEPKTEAHYLLESEIDTKLYFTLTLRRDKSWYACDPDVYETEADAIAAMKEQSEVMDKNYREGYNKGLFIGVNDVLKSYLKGYNLSPADQGCKEYRSGLIDGYSAGYDSYFGIFQVLKK